MDAAWRLDGRTAVIEMARASGLDLVGGPEGNDPVQATTYGTGELVSTALDEGARRIVVGVNRYEAAEEQPVELLKIDPALERKQVDRLQALRARRDSAAVESALARLKEDATHEERNLMPPIVEASRAYVTMGEMCDTLREVWGVWRETPVF